MDNQELIKILIEQIKERDEIIKTISDNMIKLSDAYIVKDREKDKSHCKSTIGIIISCLLAMSIIICMFIGSYFFADYPVSNTISGDNNSTATMHGNNNTSNQNKGGDK